VDAIGDPGAMSAAASGLRLRADQILDVASRIDRAARAAVYQGPSANRLRAGSAQRRERLVAAAGHLQDLADTLARSAAQVAEAQEAARLAAERAALEAEGED
jgi:hypothetical protein